MRIVDQRRDISIYRITSLTLAVIVSLASPGLAQTPHVAFITGDDEYRSEFSMPMIANILEAKHGMRTSIAYSRPTPQSNKDIEGLEALKTADLAVFYLRWRELPDDQLKLILDYVESGKPIVGLRTTTHSFRYPEKNPHARLNDGFGIDVMGQKWIRHHGHYSSTDVRTVPEQAGHAVLRGVRTPFHVRSWLYVVDPLHGDSQPLLMGQAINPQNNIDYGPQPVAWTKTYKGARVFFTTLGHPEDFQLEAVRRLLINGIYWALGREVPAGGVEAGIVGEYDPPAAGTK